MESPSGPIFDLFVDTLFIMSEFAIREGYSGRQFAAGKLITCRGMEDGGLHARESEILISTNCVLS